MTRNLQYVTVSAETLAERIKTMECENWTLSKGYDRLIDRISIQEGTVHVIEDYVQGGYRVSDGQAPCLRIDNEGFGA